MLPVSLTDLEFCLHTGHEKGGGKPWNQNHALGLREMLTVVSLMAAAFPTSDFECDEIECQSTDS